MDCRSRACKVSSSLCSARSHASFPQFPDCTCYTVNIQKRWGKGIPSRRARFEIQIRAGVQNEGAESELEGDGAL